MLDLIIFLLIAFVIYNFAEYRAMRWAWRKGGILGVLRMMVAIIVRLFTGIFIRE